MSAFPSLDSVTEARSETTPDLPRQALPVLSHARSLERDFFSDNLLIPVSIYLPSDPTSGSSPPSRPRPRQTPGRFDGGGVRCRFDLDECLLEVRSTFASCTAPLSLAQISETTPDLPRQALREHHRPRGVRLALEAVGGQTFFFRSLICTGARRNPATCGTN